MVHPFRKSKIEILLPDSFLDNEDTLFLKTQKIGRLMRILSIFRIGRVYFYNNNGSDSDRKIIEEVGKYLQIPPYLRKHVKISPNLRYSATLPPVQSPNHFGVTINKTKYTTGVVLSQTSHKVIIMIEKKRKIEIQQAETYALGDFVVVINNEGIYRICKNPPKEFYWCTELFIENMSLDQCLALQRSKFVIAASKSGDNFTQNTFNSLQNQKIPEILCILGPIKGSLRKYVKNISLVNMWLNVVPNQGTKTVKIEEALHSSLTLLNVCSFDFK